MGHAGLSTLLVLMLPILLAPLQATTAARVPDQDIAEGHFMDNAKEIRNGQTHVDPETASIIKSKAAMNEQNLYSLEDSSREDLPESMKPGQGTVEEAHIPPNTLIASKSTLTDDESNDEGYDDGEPSSSTETSLTSTETSYTSIESSPTSTESSPSSTESSPSSTESSTSSTDFSSSSTDSSPTSTDFSSSSTDSSSSSTDSSTSSTDSSPFSTESSPSTSETSSTETSTESSTSEAPPDLDLYKETENELEQITTILDNFIALVDTGSKAVHVESVASARRRWGHRDLPVAWWKRVKSSRPRADIDFCVDGSEEGVDTTTCIKLQTQLQETDDLVGQLTENVDDWHASDLMELTVQKEGLQDTYEEADALGSVFQDSVNDQFTDVVISVKVNVQSGSTVVQEKIADLEDNTGDDNTGSIALVATLGSVGGLMVLSLIGVMIYGAVQKSKTKKKLSPKKAKNENIPIDAYSHDGPGRSPAKNDPYSAAPVPAPRNYHQPGHFDPRREPVYPEPVSGRPQQGLRRTNY